MASSQLEIVYKINAEVSDFKRSIGTSADALKKLDNALGKTQTIIANALSGKTGRNGLDLSTMFEKAAQDAELLRQKMTTLSKIPQTKANAGAIVIAKNDVKASAAQYAASVVAAGRAANAEYRLGEAERKAAQQTDIHSKAINAELKTMEALNSHLVSARYAFYDLANESARFGTAMIGLGIATTKVAMDFQRAFVDVQRTYNDTNGNAVAGVAELRSALIDLSTSTSLSFVDLSKLATLANQFGIAGKDIASFTQTAAEFSVVTGTAVETSATAFARISQLMGIAGSEYDALASSVLYAGRNAIATEEQILTLTQQLAATAKQAGMTTEQTVGLATALASLGVAPEMARGSILRLFGEFDKVVAQGGKNLEDFAAVMGMTSQGVKDLWSGPNKNAVEFLTRFSSALGDTAKNGGSANLILSQLGINQVRDIQVLQKLAGNQDLLAKSLADATKGYKDATDVHTQFELVMGTLTEKLTKLNNAIQAFADSAGGKLIPMISGIVDGFASFFAIIAKNDTLSWVAGVTIAAASLTGAFLLISAMTLRFSATMLGAKFVLNDLKIEGNLATLGFKGMALALKDLIPSQMLATKTGKEFAIAMKGTAFAAEEATLATKALGYAMKASTVLLVADVVLQLGASMQNASQNTSELTKELLKLKDTQEKIDTASFLKKLDSPLVLKKGSLSSFQENLNTIKVWTGYVGDEAKKSLKGIDKTLANLVKSGNGKYAAEIFTEMGLQASGVNVSIAKLKSLMPQYSKAALDAADATKQTAMSFTDAENATGTLSDQIKTDLGNAFTETSKKQSDMSNAMVGFAQALKNSGGDMNVWTEGGAKASAAFETLINVISDQAPNMQVALSHTAAAIKLIENAGGDATDQVQALLQQLNSTFGVSIPYKNINTIKDLTKAIRSMSDVSAETKQSMMQLLDGGNYSKALQTVFTRLSKDIAVANAQVKTFADYANELSGVLKRAFDLRFGKQNALMAMNEVTAKINENLKSAQDKINSINGSMQDTQTKRNDLQIQLDYAIRSGDTATQSAILQEMAQLDKDLASQQQDLAYSTELLSGSTDINTQAGRDNVSAVEDMIQSNIDYVSALASTGASQKDITKAINNNKEAFKAQLRAMGLSEAEVIKYSKAFDDMVKSVKTLPPSVTVKANTDPARQALDEFQAQANKTTATMRINADMADIKALVAQAEKDRKAKMLEILTSRLANTKEARAKQSSGSPMWHIFDDQVKAIQATITSGNYAKGGLVTGPGTGTSDSIAANLSNGEYVIRANAVKAYGVDFLNAINGQRPVASMPMSVNAQSVSAGPQVVYLSANDRALLQAAVNRPVTLYTSDRVIAESANNGNRQLAKRGKN